MRQITPSEMEGLREALALYGLDVRRKPRGRVKPFMRESQAETDLARVKAWKPETAAGRRCKAAMLYWADYPKPREPRFSVEWFVTEALGFKSRRAPLDPTAYFLECMAYRGPALLTYRKES